MIRWEPSLENLNCNLKYRYSLSVDKVGNITETIDDRRIEFKVEHCTNYSIAVWSIGVEGSNETISRQPARHIGRTDTQGKCLSSNWITPELTIFSLLTRF